MVTTIMVIVLILLGLVLLPLAIEALLVFLAIVGVILHAIYDYIRIRWYLGGRHDRW